MIPPWLPLNRYFAQFLVPGFIRWKISANAITTLALLCGLAGNVAFLQGKPPFFVWGAVGFLLANILDECDGEVARRTQTASGFGSWFDSLSDVVVHMGFFLSLGWGLTIYTSEGLWGILGSFIAAEILLASFLCIRREILLRGKAAWVHLDPDSEVKYKRNRVDVVRGWFRTDFSLIVVISILLGWKGWILWGGLIGAICFWIPVDLWIMYRARAAVVRSQVKE